MTITRNLVCMTGLVALMAMGCKESSDDEQDTATDTTLDPDTATDSILDTLEDTVTPDVVEDPTPDPDAVSDPEEDPLTDMTADSEMDVPSDVPEDTPVEGDVLDEDAVACVPSWALINEVIPDENGAEGSSDESFIEIYTEAGVDLTGAVLEGVNGSGGGTYFTVDLSGTVDTDGLFVVSESTSGVANTDQEMTSLNIQNGPDNIVIRDSCGTILDAFGYGTFDTGDTFAGEGTAADTVSEGHTHARCPGAPVDIDTDDNSADFHDVATPTPGEANANFVDSGACT